MLEQQVVLGTAFDSFSKTSSRQQVHEVYRQMKMYNDPSTNPVLYGKK
jgi:hypothetical protein